jgi:hypothetical protein
VKPRGRRVDCSAASFLPICPDCSWRGLPRPSRPEAQGAAIRHAGQVHGLHNLTNATTRRRLVG